MTLGILLFLMGTGVLSMFMGTGSAEAVEPVGDDDDDGLGSGPDAPDTPVIGIPGDGPPPGPTTPVDPTPDAPTPDDPAPVDPAPVDPVPEEPVPDLPLPAGVSVFTDDEGIRTFIFDETYRGGGTITGSGPSDVIDMSALEFRNFVTINADGSALIGYTDDTVPPTAVTSVHEFVLGGSNTDFDARAYDGPVTATAMTGVNYMLGGSGETTLIAMGGENYMEGRAGPTQFYALGGDNEMVGGSGASQFVATAGDNYMYGGEGSNSFFAGPGQDSIFLGPGENYVYAAYGLQSFGAPVSEPSYLGSTFIEGGPVGSTSVNYVDVGLGDTAAIFNAEATTYRITGIGAEGAGPAEIASFNPDTDRLSYVSVVADGDGPLDERPVFLEDTSRGVMLVQDGRDMALIYDLTVADLLALPADAFRTDEVYVLPA